MTRRQMIKRLREWGWRRGLSKELEKCFTYELRRALLLEDEVSRVWPKGGRFTLEKGGRELKERWNNNWAALAPGRKKE